MERSIDIQARRSEVFRHWRRLEYLPKFMRHLREVRAVTRRRSHWVVDGPAGSSVEWDAEIINERENELIAWQSVPGAVVQNAGSVRFEDLNGGGTRLTVRMEFHPPAGAVGAAVAKLLGESPDQQLEEDLLRFRHEIERAADDEIWKSRS